MSLLRRHGALQGVIGTIVALHSYVEVAVAYHE